MRELGIEDKNLLHNTLRVHVYLSRILRST